MIFLQNEPQPVWLMTISMKTRAPKACASGEFAKLIHAWCAGRIRQAPVNGRESSAHRGCRAPERAKVSAWDEWAANGECGNRAFG